MRQIERKALLIDTEATLVEALTSELMVRAPAARRQAVREGRRYQLLALSDSLRADSRIEVFRDLAKSVELAELSAEIADCLDTTFYGSRAVADTRALSWAAVANSRRLAGDFFGAERTFQVATTLLESGTGSPSEQAEVSSLLASLRAEQARFKEALELLSSAVAAYRTLGLQREEGRILIQIGHTAFLSGDPGRAVTFYEEALELLDREDDDFLRLLAHHNIASCLNEAGASAEARQYLQSIYSHYEDFAEDRSMQVRRRWLEGRIAAGLESYREAASILTEVRNLFVEQEKAFETAQVMLDLAAVYLHVGDLARVKHLAREMYPVFRSQDIHREAVAALLLFERAVAAETATAALAQDVARYLTRARNNPYLRYEAPQPCL